MKILVCISKTPETTAKISFTNDNKSFQAEGVQHIMNPYDEWYALVRALELKEALGGTVTAINVGPATNDIVIRKALAIGADDAVRVDKDPQTSMDAAIQIASHAKDKGYDAIFLGKETIDYGGAEVGSMLAHLLDLPFISFVSNLEVEDGKFLVTRDLEGGVEVLEAEGPIVLSAAKGLAEQRIPNMKGIMMAKRKPMEVVAPSEANDSVEVVSFSLPAEKQSVKLVDPENMDELVRLLHDEAKAI